MENIIISGANGFIGSLLVKKYRDNGYNVFALVKDYNENVEHIKKYATIIICELSDIEQIVKQLKFKEESIFYHLAWIGVNGNQKASYESQIQNIKMTCDCITIAKEIGCKRFLCAGTIAERAIESFPTLRRIGPGVLYAVSKKSTHLFTELLCKNYGLDFVWMQFSNIYGPTNKTGNLISYALGQFERNEKAIFGPALQPYDFIYVDDLVEAVFRLGVAKSLSRDSYFIGSGTPRILKEYLIEIGRASGKEDLLHMGIRPDDGIRYSFDMFDSKSLEEEIGKYISKSFSEGIKYTIDNY